MNIYCLLSPQSPDRARIAAWFHGLPPAPGRKRSDHANSSPIEIYRLFGHSEHTIRTTAVKRNSAAGRSTFAANR